MLTDIPQKNELKWAYSSDVAEVKYSKTRKSGREMCLITRDKLCLYVNSKQAGFSELDAAITNGVNYSIGFNQEHEIFSDSPKLYNIIYAIEVDGVAVRSYEKMVKDAQYIFFGLLALGAFLVGYALYVLRITLRANLTFKRDRQEAARPLP